MLAYPPLGTDHDRKWIADAKYTEARWKPAGSEAGLQRRNEIKDQWDVVLKKQPSLHFSVFFFFCFSQDGREPRSGKERDLGATEGGAEAIICIAMTGELA